MKSSRTRAETHLFGRCSKLHKRQAGAKTVTEVDALEQGAAHCTALKATLTSPVTQEERGAHSNRAGEQVTVTYSRYYWPEKASL